MKHYMLVMLISPTILLWSNNLIKFYCFLRTLAENDVLKLWFFFAGIHIIWVSAEQEFLAIPYTSLLFLCCSFLTRNSFLMQSIGSLQKKYNIGSFELLSKTAPIQAVSLLVLGPIIDYYLSANLILDYKFTSGAVVSMSLLYMNTLKGKSFTSLTRMSLQICRCSYFFHAL